MHNNPTHTSTLDDWTEYQPNLKALADDIGGYDNIKEIFFDQDCDPEHDITNEHHQYFKPTDQDLEKADLSAQITEVEEAKNEAKNERDKRTQIIEMNSNYIHNKIYGNDAFTKTHKSPSDTVSLKAIDTNNGLITHRIVKGRRIVQRWGKDHDQHMEQLKKDGELYS